MSRPEPASIDAVAALGDVSDINCWSGIPWHFAQAARELGESAMAWTPAILDHVTWRRRWWNLRRLIVNRGIGGYQYSQDFLDRAEADIPEAMWAGHVVTFNQHFPRAASIRARGGRLSHYLDATFASFCTRDGLAGWLPKKVQDDACRLECENFAGSERIVTMARWAADSAARVCGVPSTKVFTILPGANLRLPHDYAFPCAPGIPGRDRPLVLGFVGKDWARKGLPFLLAVRAGLGTMGLRAVVRSAGNCPPSLLRTEGLEYTGFIDKARDSKRFIEFLAGCDLGCLFSSHEPLGISTLEFLHAGVPVAGFAIEGMADTLPPDAGLRFPSGTSAEAVAQSVRDLVADPSRYAAARAAARAWSPLVTWRRCVSEWLELLRTGTVASPVRPWTGLPTCVEASS